MKKVLVASFSTFIALSFSAVVFASNLVTPCAFKTTKQLILSEDEPAPAPEPAPEPTPEPTPAPEPE